VAILFLGSVYFAAKMAAAKSFSRNEVNVTKRQTYNLTLTLTVALNLP